MVQFDYFKLSKEISYALRHAPREYGLELDDEGWVSIEQLVDALNNVPKWKELMHEDIREMICKSSKKRHEICGNKIRALYGHSISKKIMKTVSAPPQFLYHGTTHKSIKNILKVGLMPQKRQYVHLSSDIETAIDVGKRRDENPVILIVESKKAYEEGVQFYLGDENTWLSQPIPNKYIEIFSSE